MQVRNVMLLTAAFAVICTGLSTPASASYNDAYRYWLQSRAYPHADVDWARWSLGFHSDHPTLITTNIVRAIRGSL